MSLNTSMPGFVGLKLKRLWLKSRSKIRLFSVVANVLLVFANCIIFFVPSSKLTSKILHLDRLEKTFNSYGSFEMNEDERQVIFRIINNNSPENFTKEEITNCGIKIPSNKFYALGRIFGPPVEITCPNEEPIVIGSYNDFRQWIDNYSKSFQNRIQAPLLIISIFVAILLAITEKINEN